MQVTEFSTILKGTKSRLVLKKLHLQRKQTTLHIDPVLEVDNSQPQFIMGNSSIENIMQADGSIKPCIRQSFRQIETLKK